MMRSRRTMPTVWNCRGRFAAFCVARSVLRIAVVLILAATACRADAEPSGSADVVASPCEEIVDAWVQGLCARVVEAEGLYRIATEAGGPPASCSGSVTGEFEDRKFGDLRCEWSSGQRFTLSTFPPESSVVELQSAAGLARPDELRGALKEYVKAIGLEIDWSNAETRPAENGSVEEFSEETPGTNAFVRLRYDREHQLIGVSVSMAL